MKWWFISILFLASYFWRLSSLPKFSIPENQPVKIIGRVTRQPYLKGSYQIINMGPVLIRTNRFPGYFYGDKLVVVGGFKKQVINSFLTQYFAFFPTIQKIEEEQNLVSQKNFIRLLLKTRGQVEQNLNQLLPEPQASLLLGVVFGVKSQMPENFWQNLRKTGTLHLVVASGQNVVMVTGFLMNSLVWFSKRRGAILITFLGIIIYVLMVGAEAPAVRAGLMAMMIFMGQLLGREGNQGKFLLLTAMVMLLISPLMLFDIGFQLSFAATAGIIWIYPMLKSKTFCSSSENFDSVSDSLANKRTFLNKDFGARKVKPHKICWTCHVLMGVFSLPLLGEAFLVTISAQLATLPLLLVNFGQFSWLSPLVNSLILPTIPIVMALGIILSGLSFVSRLLSQLLAWFIWPFLTWFVKVVDFFGQLPIGNWEVGKISWWWMVGYYLLLFLWLMGGASREHK
jgi:competence protein ComEC